MGFAYKVLGPNREPWHGGSGRWPQRKRWTPRIDTIQPCESGYHLCADEHQLLQWLGPDVWVAEYEGEPVNTGDKIVVGRARLISRVDGWDDRAARLFACDCAERVAHLNPDPRVAECIAVARRYANGEATDEEREAARAAAAAAAWAAAWTAAGAVAGAVAEAAARAAAWAAAEAAARAGAEARARAAAADAAGAGAGARARAAARAAAEAAERQWQARMLKEITGGL